MKIPILNGPNLDLPGMGEHRLYGSTRRADVEQSCRDAGRRPGAEIVGRVREGRAGRAPIGGGS